MIYNKTLAYVRSTGAGIKCLYCRLGGTFLGWYQMKCGVNQAGFLSLLNYTAFINPLLWQRDPSSLRCKMCSVPSKPVGYANDLSLYSIFKHSIGKYLAWSMTAPVDGNSYLTTGKVW